MNFFVRNFKPNDYHAVLDVWQKTDMGGEHRGDNLEIISKTIANGACLLVLVNDSDKPLGTSWITNDNRRLYLHHFGILPEFQGQGLSHLLMAESMSFAKKSGLQIKLEVHKNNKIAKALYEKYGFNYLGDYDVHIIRKY